MNEHLYDITLTAHENVEGVTRTYLGQAHFAGTGPKGKTCRECSKFCSSNLDGSKRTPVYEGRDDGKMHLADARCHHQIANKADRVFPCKALACSFFEHADNPAVIVREKKKRSKKVEVAA